MGRRNNFSARGRHVCNKGKRSVSRPEFSDSTIGSIATPASPGTVRRLRKRPNCPATSSRLTGLRKYASQIFLSSTSSFCIAEAVTIITGIWRKFSSAFNRCVESREAVTGEWEIPGTGEIFLQTHSPFLDARGRLGVVG